MKIHCFGMVKNEADVLGFTLDAALEWADSIHLCDNGSTDGTYDLLQSYAERYPEVFSYSQTLEPFTEGLRVKSIEPVLHRASEGDWWCLLDSDEIYIDNPRDFLARVKPKHGKVESASIQFYFTEQDAARYEGGAEGWAPEDSVHYLMNWSETRFVRHQPGVSWSGRWPDNLHTLRTCPDRIRLLHYQYRTPEQISQRLRSRVKSPAAFQHEVAQVWIPLGLSASDLVPSGPILSPEDLWKTRVVQSSALKRYDPVRPPQVDERQLPPLWQPPGLATRIWHGGKRRLKSLVGR